MRGCEGVDDKVWLYIRKELLPVSGERAGVVGDSTVRFVWSELVRAMEFEVCRAAEFFDYRRSCIIVL